MKFITELAQKNNHILSDEQLTAASHIHGSALTLAVPGSGKTTLLLYRAANLIINENINAKNLLTLTFSKSAATDMNLRYKRDIMPYTHQILNISTIHSFCFKIVRAYYKHKNISLNILGEGGQYSKRQIINNLYYQHTNKFISQEISEEVSRMINIKKNQQNDYPLSTKLIPIELFNMLFSSYENFKKQYNLIDFDDMLTKTLMILENHPKTVNYYNLKFPYIQIDEAQDTSSIQNRIISIIAGKNPNIFMVADDDQSIYQFRGASPNELLEFQKKFPNSKIYHLSRNFRCSANIIKVCKTLIENNEIRYNKPIQILDTPYNKPVMIRYFNDINTRNQYIISDTLNQPLSNISPIKSTAILYRNHLSSISIIDALDRANGDFQIKDANNTLMENKIIKDILAFFQFALIPQDKESFIQIAYKMDIFISKKAINVIKNTNSTQPVLDILRMIPEQSIKLQTQWIRLADNFDKIRSLSPYEAIIFIERDLGYLKKLKSQCAKAKISFTSQRSILSTLKQIAYHQNTLIEFMERIKYLDILSKTAQKNTSSLQLLTIHSSKGLEFDKVIIIDIDKGILPSQKNREEDPKQWEEERRLLYVAMSRARHQLEILQLRFINNKYIQPSPFIKEISEDSSINIINPPIDKLPNTLYDIPIST